MVVGERFEKDGKMYEVTQLLANGNYAFKVADPEPVKTTVEDKPVNKPKAKGKKV